MRRFAPSLALWPWLLLCASVILAEQQDDILPLDADSFASTIEKQTGPALVRVVTAKCLSHDISRRCFCASVLI
jgi:hypothetical protein